LADRIAGDAAWMLVGWVQIASTNIVIGSGSPAHVLNDQDRRLV
jgi:hypothetical protein